MLINICPCRRCDGDEPMTGLYGDEAYCAQCGQPVLPDDGTYAGAGEVLHEECLTEYAFTDVTRGELLDFAETHMAEFMRYVVDIRNLRQGGMAL